MPPSAHGLRRRHVHMSLVHTLGASSFSGSNHHHYANDLPLLELRFRSVWFRDNRCIFRIADIPLSALTHRYAIVVGRGRCQLARSFSPQHSPRASTGDSYPKPRTHRARRDVSAPLTRRSTSWISCAADTRHQRTRISSWQIPHNRFASYTLRFCIVC